MSIYELQAFWDDYARYLLEPGVARAHTYALKTLGVSPLDRTLNLGCGRYDELRTRLSDYYTNKTPYCGVDLSPPVGKGYVKGDYSNFSNGCNYGYFEQVVSLFSTECCLSHDRATALYVSLLSDRSSVYKRIIVSGFRYIGEDYTRTVKESRYQLESYQTPPLEATLSNPIFTETRLEMRVPSAMFGPNVIEVWRRLDKVEGER